MNGLTTVWSVAVFVMAGLCEIGGGWLVWQAIRENKSRWWIAPGAVALVAYGFVPATLLPDTSSTEFGRAFAVYGGIFIVMSLAWALLLDDFSPDLGDFLGASIALLGVGIMWCYPR